jgi:Flp pilus assembly protein TadB
LELQAKIKGCEHDISEIEAYRMSLIRQRPEKLRTRAQRGTELYILIGIVLLCLVGVAMSIEPQLGLLVLLAAGAGIYLWFRGQVQTGSKTDRQIAHVEQQIENKKQELRQLHQQITSLNLKGNH